MPTQNQQVVNALREKKARLAALIAAAAGALEEVAHGAAVATAARGEAPASYAPDASRRGHSIDVMQLALSEIDAEILAAVQAAELQATRLRVNREEPAQRRLAELLVSRRARLLAAAAAAETPADFLPAFAADEVGIVETRAELAAVAALIAAAVAA